MYAAVQFLEDCLLIEASPETRYILAWHGIP
jgi:hypothetical protein